MDFSLAKIGDRYVSTSLEDRCYYEIIAVHQGKLVSAKTLAGGSTVVEYTIFPPNDESSYGYERI